ncbi:unnamed protein product [Euphydryas editha]|uniref:Uncharacterized protein n=1 Tax=Euphydryas editha TaxID=104508 RepID=A0AAU9V9L8_EUPED|nr:unnamed protein product [Euphydryas editha]
MAVSCPEVMYGAYYPYLYGRGAARSFHHAPHFQYDRTEQLFLETVPRGFDPRLSFSKLLHRSQLVFLLEVCAPYIARRPLCVVNVARLVDVFYF